MKKTLFRGKRTGDNQWAYGSYVFQDNKHLIFENETTWHHYIHPSTVGQFTGKCDKNGKKVFEGDIVNLYIRGKLLGKYIAKWDEQYAGFYFCTFKGVICFVLGIYSSKDIEIIGNIHDNKNLITNGGN